MPSRAVRLPRHMIRGAFCTSECTTDSMSYEHALRNSPCTLHHSVVRRAPDDPGAPRSHAVPRRDPAPVPCFINTNLAVPVLTHPPLPPPPFVHGGAPVSLSAHRGE